MLSKNKIKLIKSLELKKFREKEKLFIVEGEKLTIELLQTSKFQITTLIATDEWINKNIQLNSFFPEETIIASKEEINKISLLKTPQDAVCIAILPDYQPEINNFSEKLLLVLNKIQDPGNLGTIIRIADWFGIENIFCSSDTVDVYNPKVIQATMGAIFRVNICYGSIYAFIESASKLNVPIYGTTLDGENLYKTTLGNSGIIIMGNESKGIDEGLFPYLTKKISIPFYPENEKRSESLNVGVATAIICGEFRRRQTLY